MKKLFFLLLLPVFVKAQQKDTVQTYYSEVVNVDTTSADVLYSRGKLMIAKIFNSGKTVTQLNDDNAKRIVTKGLFTIYFKMMMTNYPADVDFTTIIQCKDNKFKYEITIGDFVSGTDENRSPISTKPPPLWSQKKWNGVLHSINLKADEIIATIKTSMASSSNDNW